MTCQLYVATETRLVLFVLAFWLFGFLAFWMSEACISDVILI